MTKNDPKLVPEPSLRRLPLYYQYLKSLSEKGAQNISSQTIGTDLNLDPTQVRKDLALTGVEGKPKVGYEISHLIREIAQFLGWNNVNSAFLVGAGHLGSALLGYPQFSSHGLSIVAGFDTDPMKIGKEIYGKMIMPLERLPDLSRRMSIHIGIITVPAHVAQGVAELMLQGGIKAIWNFSPTTLKVPEGVIVQNEELYYSLAALSHRLAQSLHLAPEAAAEGDAGAEMPTI
ncbi:MAG: redox-sensing transcriptional repressor Rex [Spirochaetes bacterium]|nr:redox-sensing transcriptional repressor Rex [Spirochaetota bacterium]